MASIQTRTIGVVIFGQCLLVLRALNSLCFTAFTITVTLMPSLKQPLQPFSWDFGFWGDLAMSCLLSIHFVNCFIAFKQPFSLGFWIWSTSCLACAPSTLSYCILLHIISDPMQRKRSCSPAHKQPTFLGILRFLSFAKDLFGVCLCFQKVFLHWFRYRTY